MNCPKCQVVLEAGTLFCSSCGHALSQQGAPQQKKTLFWSPQASAEQASQGNAPAMSPVPAPGPAAAPTPSAAAPPPGAAPAPSYGAPAPGAAPPPGAAPAPSYGAPAPGGPGGYSQPPAGGPGGPYGGAPQSDQPDDRSHPVRLIMPYPENGNRLQALFFTVLPFIGFFMLIPHFFWAGLLGMWKGILGFLTFWVILFTGKFPQKWWEFMRKVARYELRISGYSDVMTLGYPKFSIHDEEYGLDLDVPYPEKSSRLWLFFSFYVIFPVFFVHIFYSIWAAILGFLGSWAVLFTGRFPRSWFEFIRKTKQHRLRIMFFANWLRNEYPPFGLKD